MRYPCDDSVDLARMRKDAKSQSVYTSSFARLALAFCLDHGARFTSAEVKALVQGDDALERAIAAEYGEGNEPRN